MVTETETREVTDKKTTTGIAALDRHLEIMSYEAVAVAYVILEIRCVNNKLGDTIRESLRKSLKPFMEGEQPEVAIGCEEEIDAINWWLGFLEGLWAGDAG